MSQIIAPFLLLAALVAALVMHVRAQSEAPDPRDRCADKRTQAERDQCENLIDFAMSAGL